MTINFIKGLAIIKSGRRTVAKIYDRPEYFKGTKLEGKYSERYSLELTHLSVARECTTLEEVVHYLTKYTKIDINLDLPIMSQSAN